MARSMRITARSFTCSMNIYYGPRAIRPCLSSFMLSRTLVPHASLSSDSSAQNKLINTDYPPLHGGRWKKRMDKFLALSSIAGFQYYKNDYSLTNPIRFYSNGSNILHSKCILPVSCSSTIFQTRTYASRSGSKQDGLQSVIENVPIVDASNSRSTDAAGNELPDMLTKICESVVDAAKTAGNKARELSDEAFPYLQKFYDSHPYLEKVIVPVGWTLSATVVAWFVMPRIFRKIHQYASHSPLALLSRNSTREHLAYEKSLWSALEDPARYLITFMAFSQLGVVIAPTAADYLSQAWRGASVLSFIWFLHRWKTNFFASALASQVTAGIDRDKLLTLEKLSSVGLIVLGIMALAEAFGVPVQSIITVGGIGGVATAFAARDILGNLLSGLSLQFTKPFSVGDQIKAGSIEGQVMEMGLTTTSLISPEKFPVIVPNSLFSSQVIVNKSRAQWRAISNKIPIRIEDIEKVSFISNDIRSMLQAHPKVFLEKDAPYCYLSRIDFSYAEVTVGCNLKSMRKDEFFAAEQDILLQAAKIMRQHGAELGANLSI